MIYIALLAHLMFAMGAVRSEGEKKQKKKVNSPPSLGKTVKKLMSTVTCFQQQASLTAITHKLYLYNTRQTVNHFSC